VGDSDLKFAVEALLFASERPLQAEEIRQAFSSKDGESVGIAEIDQALSQLKEDYVAQGRGFELAEIAGGFQLVSHPRFSSYLKSFYQSREKKKLSQAALETLSVIAYRQPVTKADIEFIRGVNVDGALKTLLEKEFVRIVARKEVPGRPMLYGTTKQFLEHFGLNALKDLPALSEYTLKDLPENLLPPDFKPTVQEEAGEQKAVGCDNEDAMEATN
jgi:segregation and condensation protein B